LEKLSFVAIGQRIAVSANMARMRFARALPRLADRVAALRRGVAHPPVDELSG
jgi:hypothetical protein